jgi:hypothetical protein
MSRRMGLVVCVVGTVLTFVSAGALQADTANLNMIASETGGSPSPTFGPWQIGWADPLTYPAAAPVGGGALAGWGEADADWAPYVFVNTTGAPWGSSPGLHLAKDEMGFHPGNVTDGGGFAILKWTAPMDGKINISTIFEDANAATTANYVMLVHGGTYTHLAEGTIDGSHHTLTYNLTGVSVVAGDSILVDVGSNGDNTGDFVGVFHTIDYVPEPSSTAIMASALIGLLAYAWRKRK